MSNKHGVPISKLLEALTEDLSVEEVLSAKVLAEISTQISSERIKRNMNQNEFAEFMGTAQTVVSKWESSDRNFTIKKLVEIACKLDLELSIKFKEIVKIQPLATNKILQFPAVGAFAISETPKWTESMPETVEYLKEN